ncbi:hypothetical protein KS4_08820 [Poriferisphaera corsica]|uniref:Sialate O-acetylesterase domain-containing protein n=1 Tax=Poriferisphaera corsica TaxID=2528020 RepID=A0A517YRI3_9BACT|nr:sialate O-acetylesterase [Poriferisphaera corsica]QDU32846.1 hypothetical protein KS4_08820 [Poriferisphaera corsica]
MKIHWMYRYILLFSVILLTIPNATALDLPAAFTDHAVLQHGVSVPVWGWTDNNAQVEVTFQGHTITTTANADGEWQLKLPPLKPSKTPANMSIRSGSESTTVKDILVGEVWLCSGQSNMEWILERSLSFDNVKQNPNTLIRMITVPRKTSSVRLKSAKTKWQTASSNTVGRWSAVGYHFAEKLQQELDMPVGMLSISWGGTLIEPWIPIEGYQRTPEVEDIYNKIKLSSPSTSEYETAAKKYVNKVEDWIQKSNDQIDKQKPISSAPAFPKSLKPLDSNRSPTALYNGMINPFVPYAIKGVIWYQGESNHTQDANKIGPARWGYLHKTKALLAGWRYLWDNPTLPYYFVQIAPYNYKNNAPDVLPQFWESQAEIEKQLPNTGMVVVNDIGNISDIHPRNKLDVGHRLANLALHETYGKTEIVARGPQLRDMIVSGNQLRLNFNNAADGLDTRDGKSPSHFEIAGTKTSWRKAKAKIESKDTIILSAKDINQPVAVRYAWDMLAEPNLINSVGLPTGAFRHGELPDYSKVEKNIPDRDQYTVVYEADLNKAKKKIVYDINNTNDIQGFDRIAYMLELNGDQGYQWVFVSMDAFTDDIQKIAVPTADSKAVFQQQLDNLNVYSNNNSLKNGNHKNGNIEFWATNYKPNKQSGVASASDEAFDHSDTNSKDGDYGSMQIHIANPAETVFALNHWVEGSKTLDIGIGSQSSGNADWTFAKNGGRYKLKKLTVLVRKADPDVMAAIEAKRLKKQAIAAEQKRKESKKLKSKLIRSIPEIRNYTAVYTTNLNNAGPAISYDLNISDQIESFDRIAYYLELDDGSKSRWIYVSLDAFTDDVQKIGIPTLQSPFVFQTTAKNLSVLTNHPNVTAGKYPTGHIEFWPYNYGPNNQLNIPNASQQIYDHGDANKNTGDYGSMQIHLLNPASTLFAINNWYDGARKMDIGIGNSTGKSRDWTFAKNGSQYRMKTLTILVRESN